MTGDAWISGSQNTKTGPLLTQYVGSSLEEAHHTCQGCALRPPASRGGGGVCYAWSGTAKLGALGAYRSARTLGMAMLDQISKGLPRVARLGAIGDPAGLSPAWIEAVFATLRENGFAILSYTHKWRALATPQSRRRYLASTDNLSEADEAIDQGWRPTTILPSSHPLTKAHVLTPKGRKLVVCPAQRTGKEIKCATCRLCDPDAKQFAGVAFAPEGNNKKMLP